MSFINIEVLYLLLILIAFIFLNKSVKSYENYFSETMLSKLLIGTSKKRLNHVFMMISFTLLVMALARPVIKNKPLVLQKENINVVVAFDISKSMWCEDLYPNRLDFSKEKFFNFVENFKDEKVGVLGFSSESFLVSPLTNDYSALKYLVKNLNQDRINVQGSNVLTTLHTTNNTLLKGMTKKVLVIFTDGTDSDDFTKSIEYAKEQNIKVFIYATATPKGGVIKLNDGNLQKDLDGNIVVTSLNRGIKDLALQSGGAYLEHSSSSNDMKILLDALREEFTDNTQEDYEISQDVELFYIPLGLAILFYFLSLFSLKRFKI